MLHPCSPHHSPTVLREPRGSASSAGHGDEEARRQEGGEGHEAEEGGAPDHSPDSGEAAAAAMAAAHRGRHIPRQSSAVNVQNRMVSATQAEMKRLSSEVEALRSENRRLNVQVGGVKGSFIRTQHAGMPNKEKST